MWRRYLILFKIGTQDLCFKQSSLSMRNVKFYCCNTFLNAFLLCGVAVNLSPASFLNSNMSLRLHGGLETGQHTFSPLLTRGGADHPRAQDNTADAYSWESKTSGGPWVLRQMQCIRLLAAQD